MNKQIAELYNELSKQFPHEGMNVSIPLTEYIELKRIKEKYNKIKENQKGKQVKKYWRHRYFLLSYPY